MSQFRIGFHVSAWGSAHLLGALSGLGRNGFQGIEVYGDTTHVYAERPDEFVTILEISGIPLAGVHSGGTLTHPEFREAELLEWQRLLDWVAAVDGDYAIYYGGQAGEDFGSDLRAAATLLDEIGAYAAQRGVRFCYEPDRSCPFNTRERVMELLAATTPGQVWVSVDTANLVSMGFDPSFFLLNQRERIGVVHMHDVRAEDDDLVPEGLDVELGDGLVDFPSVAHTLRSIGFDGWVVGCVPKPSRAAAVSAANCADYFRDVLGFEF